MSRRSSASAPANAAPTRSERALLFKKAKTKQGFDKLSLSGFEIVDQPLPSTASMSPDELRRAMATLGYRTQSDLANAIGVSRSAVSLWLEGKVGVPRPVAMLLRMLVAARRRNY